MITSRGIKIRVLQFSFKVDIGNANVDSHLRSKSKEKVLFNISKKVLFNN